ncbi:uncharacterized protein KY384_008522 [Bacidia gigantensis]|uniref:uncharacterized protein n=1 Tax=Bacidia gigantensis TaxID=2732470 RepID=UPI001D04CF1F|nr:uncharacterized protein KY384_008522 [Bacidia gigantensis]KAG8527093.1 hypothetical protein KY384_008522 [Bacidia gigantensis]
MEQDAPTKPPRASFPLTPLSIALKQMCVKTTQLMQNSEKTDMSVPKKKSSRTVHAPVHLARVIDLRKDVRMDNKVDDAPKEDCDRHNFLDVIVMEDYLRQGLKKPDYQGKYSDEVLSGEASIDEQLAATLTSPEIQVKAHISQVRNFTVRKRKGRPRTFLRTVQLRSKRAREEKLPQRLSLKKTTNSHKPRTPSGSNAKRITDDSEDDSDTPLASKRTLFSLHAPPTPSPSETPFAHTPDQIAITELSPSKESPSQYYKCLDSTDEVVPLGDRLLAKAPIKVEPLSFQMQNRTVLLLSVSNEPHIAPVYMTLDKCPRIDQLFDFILEGRKVASEAVKWVCARLLCNDRWISLSQDQPQSQFRLHRFISEAWETHADNFEDECEVEVMIEIKS